MQKHLKWLGQIVKFQHGIHINRIELRSPERAEVPTKCREGTHRKQEKTMATLQYRGSEVVISDEAVVKPSIASYRGVTYDPSETHYHAKHIAKTLNYRGSTFEA